ncbi:hypothetical protein ACH5RR_036490 [Cinchona calisaya]|uniref:Uncharacterized protein n=1 Tax=Cinchona calisaya TaxID=153742 RepID=A0ABD2Y3C5_9GENT
MTAKWKISSSISKIGLRTVSVYQELCVFIKNCACLSLMYWVDGMDENMVHKMNVMLLKFMPCNPAIVEMYIEFLKRSETSPPDSLLMGEIVCMFVDSLLENVVVSLKDDFAILREGLVFLISFLVDPTKKSTTETGNVIDSLVKSLISSLYIYQTENYTSKERNDLVHDLLEKIEKVKIEASSDFFPCLERLVMGDCHELEEIPFSFADSLKVIQLRRCNYDVENSARQILKEQRDKGNEELEMFEVTSYQLDCQVALSYVLCDQISVVFAFHVL